MKVPLSFRNLYELQYQLEQQAVNQNVDSNELWNKAAHTFMAKRHKLLQNSLSILWWQSTLMPAVLKTHRKASFIFGSPLLPMGGHHLDCCTLTGRIQIWFDTPTENITGLFNKQDQCEQITEIYRLCTEICGTLHCLIFLVPTGAQKSQDVLSAYCWCVKTQFWTVNIYNQSWNAQDVIAG